MVVVGLGVVVVGFGVVIGTTLRCTARAASAPSTAGISASDFPILDTVGSARRVRRALVVVG